MHLIWIKLNKKLFGDILLYQDVSLSSSVCKKHQLIGSTLSHYMCFVVSLVIGVEIMELYIYIYKVALLFLWTTHYKCAPGHFAVSVEPGLQYALQ